MKPKSPSDMSWVEKATELKERFTPKTGYNVVAVDNMANPGDGLYLVKHYKTEAEADEAATAHQKKSGDKSYVYGPK